MEESYDLTDRAQELLVEAVKSYGATITTRDYNGGFFIATNGKNYGDGSARENANNRKAIEDLEFNNLIEQKASDYYNVTHDGFTYVDSLSKSE